MMNHGLADLSERERETLRLLLAGHDAKSVARAQGLSVHTVNERLRDARRKLGVSSSRAAARLLAEAEAGSAAPPEKWADNKIGVAGAGAPPADRVRPSAPQRRWLWPSIGATAMILNALTLAMAGHHPTNDAAKLDAETATAAPGQNCAECTAAAQNWLKLIDEREYQASWEASGTAFHAGVSGARWAEMSRSVREPLGAVVSRELTRANQTANLPGMARGDYAIVKFNTSFAAKAGLVETVAMAREKDSWRVIGYFILPAVVSN